MRTDRVFLGILAVLALEVSLGRAAAGKQPKSPRLDATVSWLGNSYPGGKRWVPQDVDALTVAAGGTLFSNVHWDEGGGNVTAFRDGQVLGPALYTHGWGNQGGYAIAANKTHLFIAGRMHSEGGHLQDPATWPPKGKLWTGVSRRPLSNIQTAAPFAGGKGGKGATLKESFLVVDELPEERGGLDDRLQNITGLCATDDRLYVSCPYDGTIKVFDARSMQRLALHKAPRAGPLTLDPQGRVWMLEEAGKPDEKRRVVRLGLAGKPLMPAVVFEDDQRPTSVAFSPNGLLLVADAGAAQQALVYNVSAAESPGKPAGRPLGAIGQAGGIVSGTPGRFADLKFNEPAAIACGRNGSFYVAHHGSSGGGGAVLECYQVDWEGFSGSQSPEPKLAWRLFGLEFVDMAETDPASERDLFTKEEHFVIGDAGSPGGDWRYAGYTLNRFKYPDDPRMHIWSAGAWVRRIAGRRILFVNDMNGEHLQVYRFDEAEDGEIAIPSGLFAKKRIAGDSWPPGQPERGAWLWRDLNGNGAFDAGEYQSAGADLPAAQGWWVDALGNIWLATEREGIRLWTCEGMDFQGNPQWRLESVRSFSPPEGFEQMKRLRYDAERDVMYLGGVTKEHRNQHWKPMGPVIARFDGWLSGKQQRRWQIVAPYETGAHGHTSCEPMGFDVAGEYLFVPYTGASKHLGFSTGHIEVFRASDGAAVGRLEPSAEIGEIGLQDIRECLTSRRLENGEYRVLLEEDFKAKLLMFRWKP